MSMPVDNDVRIVWVGPGWYGPMSRADYNGSYTVYYKVNTTASKGDYTQASADTYGSVGTPDYFAECPDWAKPAYNVGVL
jgi:hypothetical protein